MSSAASKANLRTVLLVTLFFGVVTGIYELALPLLLKEWNIPYEKIGVIFALSGLAMVLARPAAAQTNNSYPMLMSVKPSAAQIGATSP